MKKFIIYSFFLLIPGIGVSQSWYDLYQEGQKEYKEKNYKEAKQTLIAAKIQAQQDFGIQHANYKNTLKILAKTYFEVKDYRNCITTYKAIEKVIKDTKATKTEEYIELSESMALTYETAKNYRNAAKYYNLSLQTRANVPGKGEKTKGYVNILHSLSSLYYTGKVWKKAEENFMKLNPLAKTVYGSRSKTYWGIIKETADMFYDAKKWENALEYYNSHINANKLAKQSRKNYIDSYGRVADCYNELNNKEKTISSFNTYIKYREYIKGKQDTFYLSELDRTISVFRNINEFNPAKTLHLKKLSIIKEKPGINSAEYATTSLELAQDFIDLKDYVSAEKYIKIGIDTRKKVLTEKHEDYPKALDMQAKLKARTGKLDDADKLFLEAQNLRRDNLGTDHIDYTKGLDTLAYFYMGQKKFPEAEKLINEGLAIRAKKPGKNHPDYGASLASMADLLMAQKKFKEAEPLVKEEGKIYSSYYGSATKQNALNIKKLADLYREWEKYPLALKTYRQALVLLEGSLGKKNCQPCEDVKNSIQLVNDTSTEKK